MSKLSGWIKSHQLMSYFILTYIITWPLLLIFQPYYLEGQRLVAPLISLSIFAPALVSIGISTMLNKSPRERNRKPALIAFTLTWILASLIIVLFLAIIQEMEVTFRFMVVCIITGLLPAIVVSSIFSTTPAVRDQLRTYIKPRGSLGYYFLALGLIPAIWILGNLLSRAMGMDVSFSRYTVVDAKLILMVILFYFYNIIYGGLSEEPGWRGFALPRLQSKFSPLVASLILGVIWAVWHAPGRFGGIEAKSLSDTLVEWVLIVFVTIIFTFLFNRTKGSILVTVLIHPAMNTTGNFLNASLGTLILLLVFTIFVIVVDRMWKKLDPDNPAIYHPILQEIKPTIS